MAVQDSSSGASSTLTRDGTDMRKGDISAGAISGLYLSLSSSAKGLQGEACASHLDSRFRGNDKVRGFASHPVAWNVDRPVAGQGPGLTLEGIEGRVEVESILGGGQQ